MSADLTALQADEATIHRIATARAAKATKILWWMMVNQKRQVSVDVINRMTLAERDRIAKRAGCKTASPLTWKVVIATVETVLAEANQ